MAKGKILELSRVDKDTGKLILIYRKEVFGHI